MRIVLDTNVLVSALITKGTPPFELAEAWEADRFVLITSRAQLDEVKRVLGYEHLKRFIKPAEAEALLTNIESVAEVYTTLEPVKLSSDPSDNLIIASAIAGRADYLVTGDKRDLLKLRSAQGIPIVTPREMLELLSRKGQE